MSLTEYNCCSVRDLFFSGSKYKPVRVEVSRVICDVQTGGHFNQLFNRSMSPFTIHHVEKNILSKVTIDNLDVNHH